jgi:thiol-disulfide isomerase/thioredoxin
MNKGLLVLLVTIVIAGGIYTLVMANKQSTMKAHEMEMKEAVEMEAMQEKGGPVAPGGAAMMGADQPVEMNDATMGDDMKKEMTDTDMMKKDMADEPMAGAGEYRPYDAGQVTMASAGDVVLFFRASWCPSCRALDSDIKANRQAIPEGVTILDVNYDTETALKQKYGVTTQHTLVQVAADGSLIKKWSGGATLASVLAEVQ